MRDTCVYTSIYVYVCIKIYMKIVERKGIIVEHHNLMHVCMRACEFV